MLFFLFFLSAFLAIKFDILPQNKKEYRWGRCISMQIGPKNLVTGMFKISDAPDQIASARIIDSFGNTQYFRPVISSEGVYFSFRTHEKTLNYTFCIKSVYEGLESPLGSEKREVHIKVEMGHDLFDKEKANEIKIQPVIAEMSRLESIMHDITDGLSQIVETELEMRKCNKSTFNRLFLINIVCIFVLLIGGLWQYYDLRKFFKNKKLI